jgi:hypothetical protein
MHGGRSRRLTSWLTAAAEEMKQRMRFDFTQIRVFHSVVVTDTIF